MPDSMVLSWVKDREFQGLPAPEQARIIGNYFDKNYADGEFLKLPPGERDRIRGNFLTDHLRVEGQPAPGQAQGAPVLPASQGKPEGPEGGFLEAGNIDLAKRPVVKNPDGSISTVRSMSFNMDGQEVLVPTVSDDGRIMSDQEAVETYRRTGRHLGKFATPEAATAYAQDLHKQQEAMYAGKPDAAGTGNLDLLLNPPAGPGPVPLPQLQGQAQANQPKPEPQEPSEFADLYQRLGERVAALPALGYAFARGLVSMVPQARDTAGRLMQEWVGRMGKPEEFIPLPEIRERSKNDTGKPVVIEVPQPGQAFSVGPLSFTYDKPVTEEDHAKFLKTVWDAIQAQEEEITGYKRMGGGIPVPFTDKEIGLQRVPVRDIVLPAAEMAGAVAGPIKLSGQAAENLILSGQQMTAGNALAVRQGIGQVFADSLLAQPSRVGMVGEAAAKGALTGAIYSAAEPEKIPDTAAMFAAFDAVGAIIPQIPGLAREGRAKAMDLAEQAIHQKVVEQGLPREVTITAEELRGIYAGMEGADQAKRDILLDAFKEAGLSQEASNQLIKDALKGKQNVRVTIPTSRIIRWTDRPWWGAVKSALGQEPFAKSAEEWTGVPGVELVPPATGKKSGRKAEPAGQAPGAAPAQPAEPAPGPGVEPPAGPAQEARPMGPLAGQEPPAASPEAPTPEATPAGKKSGRKPVEKQPWQMTQEEFEASGQVSVYPYETMVQRAYAKGEAVPANVLAQFSDADWLKPAEPAAPAQEQPAAKPAAKPNPLVGQYVRSGSIEGQITEVRPDGKLVADGSLITPNAAPNYAVQAEPFAPPVQAAAEPPASPEASAQGQALAYDFANTFPKPLDLDPDAMVRIFGTSEAPSAEDVKAQHEEHMNELLLNRLDLAEVRRAEAEGEDPRTGKAPRTEKQKADLAEFFKQEPGKIERNYQDSLAAYAAGYGEDAAKALDSRVRQVAEEMARGEEEGGEAPAAHGGAAEPDVKEGGGEAGDTLEAGLHHALHSTSGAEERWTRLRERGLTDAELRQAISQEFGEFGGFSGPGRESISFTGGKSPVFVYGAGHPASDTFKAKLKGRELVAKAREVLDIPYPEKEAAPARPAKKSGRKGEEEAKPQAHPERIGVNRDGKEVRQDKNGVRRVDEGGGVFWNQDVAMVPTYGGVKKEFDSPRALYDKGGSSHNYLTAEELEQFRQEDEAKAQAKPAGQEPPAEASAGEKRKPAVAEKQEGKAEANVAKVLARAGLLEKVARPEFHTRIENPPFMDLVVETHPSPDGALNIYLTHYYEQNGDQVMDGEMVYRLDPTGVLTLKETAVQDTRTGGERRGLDRSFANVFARNLVQQGFGKAPAAEASAAQPPAKSDGKKAPVAPAEVPAGAERRVAEWVKGRIQAKEPFTFKDLLAQAGREFGGRIEDTGAFDSKAVTDAMELGVNLAIQDSNLVSNPAGEKSVREVQEQIGALKSMVELLPTQRVRSKEMDEFQQFSTPPHLAFTAAWALNIQPGETVLEPSAGVGGLAVFAQNAGATVVVNELSARRAGLLREMGFDQLHTENAEQLHNILPKDVRPTAVLMNPPFSSTAGRIQGQRKTKNVTLHLEQALRRLAPDGRLVAIVGKGLGMDNPSFIGWWKKVQGDYNVRADIRINGKEYVKYGTDFDNRILVIDKTGPTTTEVLRGQVEKVEDLVPLLEGIRNERPAVRTEDAPEYPDQRPLPRPAQGGRGAGSPDHPGGSGTHAPGAREGAGPASADRPRLGHGPDGGPAVQSAAPAGHGAPGLEGAGPGHEPGPAQSAPGEGPGEAGARPDSGSPGRDVPGRLTVSQAEASEPGQDLSDSVYDTYRPAVRVKGAKPHPGKLAESAAMAAVRPAPVSYSPQLPASAIRDGKISDAQLEAMIYAGHNHAQILPDGKRRGYFIGDGTGVGKGREIASILWDNWNQGRNKAVWISKNTPLFKDAQRDVEGVGWDMSLLFEQGKIKAADPIGRATGVLFTTYDTLKGGEKKEGGQSRLEQITAWLGKDFDGVIAFDEAHKMANAMPVKGKRGTQKPSQTALSAKDLREALPQARVVYVSATGATEPSNLAYLERLGLWGPETPFGTAEKFVNEVSAGGVAAMEMVAADMKALGLYTARNLSFDGVTYDRLVHPLSPDQRKAYNTYASAWQVVLSNVQQALELTGGDKNRDAKSAAYSAFWGSNQRFWNQVLTSLQMPTVLKDMEKQLAGGRSVLLQLVNTNEALLNRRLAELEDSVELEDLDLTPTEVIGQFVQNSFPVQAYEEYTDDEGNKRSRPVVDSSGNPVRDAQAEAMREKLLDKLGSIRGLDGPLDMVLAHFGVDQVAEITGRSRRVVWVEDEQGRRKVVQKRTQRHGDADAADFMDGRKRILVFSEAGGTGRSFHADKAAKNQQKRVHYLVQPGWRADVAIQGLGRSHRTNEAEEPHYILCTTDVPAQARFVSTIARRLDQLGALTKGQRQTGSQGLFQAKDNLENDHAKDALRSFITDLYQDRIPGLDFRTFEEQTGLKLSEQTNDGRQGALRSEMPAMTQVLNRVLSLDLDVMNKVFDEFGSRLDEIVEVAASQGLLDAGMETLRAKKIDEVRREVVHTDERTGAQTVYHELALTNDVKYLTFDQVAKAKRFLQNKRSGRVYAVTSDLRTRTDTKSGRSDGYYTVKSPTSVNQVDEWDADNAGEREHQKFRELEPEKARELWDKEIAALPQERTDAEHVVSGTLLPVWDRLPKGYVKVVRAKTAAGDVILGRVIPEVLLNDTLENLGVKAGEITPAKALERIRDGATARLANGWTIRQARVQGGQRIELTGPSYSDQKEIDALGLLQERIDFRMRTFIPQDRALEVIERLAKARPIVRVDKGAAMASAVPDRRDIPPVSSGPFLVNPVRRSAILSMLDKVLDVPIRIGGFRNVKAGGLKAAGIYKPGPVVARTRKANDVEVAAHEIAHHIQDKGLMPLPRRMPEEVRALAYEGAKNKGEEGFAEFVRLYVTQPEQAESRAPQFHAWFENELDRHPDLQDALSRARSMWEEWVAQPDVAKVMSLIRQGEAKPRRWTLNSVYRATIDEFRPFQVLAAEAEKRSGRKLAADEDPYLAAWLTRGWGGKAEHYLKRGTFQLDQDGGYRVTGPSLRDILQPVHKAGLLDLLDTYLVARRAAHDERIRKGFEGIVPEEVFANAAQEIEEAHPMVREVADQLHAYSDELLSYLVGSGRIAAETAEAVRKANLYYAPIYRVMESEAGLSPAGSGKHFGGLFNPLRRLKGSSRDIHSPVENILRNTYTIISVAERNRVGEALLKVADMPAMGRFIEVKPINLQVHKVGTAEALRQLLRWITEAEGTFSGYEDMVKGLLGDVQSVRRLRQEVAGLDDAATRATVQQAGYQLEDLEALGRFVQAFQPNAQRVRPNEAIFYRKGNPVLVELDPELAQAVKGLSPEVVSGVVKVLAIPAGWLRAGATLAPEFMIRNPMRDTFEAYLNSDKLHVPFVQMLRGLYHVLGRDAVYQKFYASGAAHSAMVSLDREYLSKDLRRLMQSRLGQVGRLLRNPLELLRAISEVGEEATRVGEFELQAGDSTDMASLARAGQKARDLTLDFSRRGSRTLSINLISAFWNASVQGTDRMIRAIKENPLRYLLRAFLGITLPSLLLWAAQKDDPKYRDLPSWRKILFWNVVVRSSSGKAIVLSLPKPFVPGILFGSFPEMMAEWITKRDPEGLRDAGRALVDSLAPGILPTALLVPVEWQAGRNFFFDRPVLPRGTEGLDPELQFDEHTSEAAKLLGRAMARVPLLKDYASPAKLQNAYGGLTGGLGRLALDAVDKGLAVTGLAEAPPAPEGDWTDLPGLRGVVDRFPLQTSRSVELFYRRYNEAQQAWESTKQRAGVRGKGLELERPAELESLENTATALSLLRRIARETHMDPKATPAAKRQVLDQVYEAMSGEARSALDRLEAMRGKSSGRKVEVKP